MACPLASESNYQESTEHLKNPQQYEECRHVFANLKCSWLNNEGKRAKGQYFQLKPLELLLLR
jgi:hypothetical protein